MSNCDSCVHWLKESTEERHNKHSYDIENPWDMDTNGPMALPFEVHPCGHPKLLFCERPLEQDGFAVADGSTYFATLYTAPKFGCVLHEGFTKSVRTPSEPKA